MEPATVALIIVAVLLAFAFGYWFKKTPRAPSATETEERMAERERRIVRLYQNLEDLMEGFEAFVDEEKASIAQERRDITALVEEVRRQSVPFAAAEPLPPPKPARKPRGKAAAKEPAAEEIVIEPVKPDSETAATVMPERRFEIVLDENDAVRGRNAAPRAAEPRNVREAALDAIFPSNAPAGVTGTQPALPGPLPGAKPPRRGAQSRADSDQPVQAATAAARLEAARRMEPVRSVGAVERVDRVQAIGGVGPDELQRAAESVAAPGRYAAPASRRQTKSEEQESRITAPSWQVISSQNEPPRSSKTDRVMALHKQGVEASIISQQLGLAQAEVQLIIEMSALH